MSHAQRTEEEFDGKKVILGYSVIILRITLEHKSIWGRVKLQDLLPFRKFVHGRMKGRKRKYVDGQIFKKAANLGP